MSRRNEPLTPELVADLPGLGGTCLFMELDPVGRSRIKSGEELAAKTAWVREVTLEWGTCGQVARAGDRIVGFTLYAPPAYVPGAGCLPTSPVSDDAVLLTTLYVDPDVRGRGWGRALVQAALRDLTNRPMNKRGAMRALECFGRRECAAAQLVSRQGPYDCVVPAEFLQALGFGEQRSHPTYPRMRLDLRATVSWKDEVERALLHVWGAVNPTQQNAPTALPEGGPPARTQAREFSGHDPSASRPTIRRGTARVP